MTYCNASRLFISPSVLQLLFHVRLSHLPATSIVTVTPYHLLLNNTDLDLQVREVEGDRGVQLTPNACLPFWPRTADKLVIVRIERNGLESKEFPVRKKEQEVTSTETLVLRLSDQVRVCVLSA